MSGYLASRRWQRVIYGRDLVCELVIRDIKLRYQHSILGAVWAVLNPLAYMLVFSLIRGALGVAIPGYALFALIGIVTWNWFREGLMLAANAITNNRQLIERPGFPTAVLPPIAVLTALVDLLVAIPLLMIFVVFSSEEITGAVLVLPLVMAAQFLLILGLGYVVAALNVTYRDTHHLLGVVLMVLFFLTPIFYDASAIPTHYQAFYNLNPMVHLVAAYRAILVQGSLPDLRMLLVLTLLGGGMAWLGHAIFDRVSYRFVEEL